MKLKWVKYAINIIVDVWISRNKVEFWILYYGTFWIFAALSLQNTASNSISVYSKNNAYLNIYLYMINSKKYASNKKTQVLGYNAHYRMHFYTGLSTEFVHKVHCAFELIMICKNILSIPGMQLTTEDCIWCISQLLTWFLVDCMVFISLFFMFHFFMCVPCTILILINKHGRFRGSVGMGIPTGFCCGYGDWNPIPTAALPSSVHCLVNNDNQAIKLMTGQIYNIHQNSKLCWKYVWCVLNNYWNQYYIET